MSKEETNNSNSDKPAKTGKNIALKDHVLFAPPHIKNPIEIKKGDDLTKIIDKIDIKFTMALQTEGVLKGK